jgi:hypothetical protein
MNGVEVMNHMLHTENDSLKKLLARYIAHVQDIEGVTFIDHCGPSGPGLPEADQALLNEIRRGVRL